MIKAIDKYINKENLRKRSNERKASAIGATDILVFLNMEVATHKDFCIYIFIILRLI